MDARNRQRIGHVDRMERDADLRAGFEQLALDRHAIALEHFTVAADHAVDAADRRAAVAFAAQVTLTLERPYETIAWAEQLRDESPTPDEANLLEAAAWVALADGAQALALLAEVTAPDTDDTTYPPSLVHQLRCQAHGFVGNVDDALVEAFTALLTNWELPEIWRALAVLGASHDVDVDDAVACIPDDGVLQVLGWLIDAPAVGTDRIAEALWQRAPGDPRVLAMLVSLGHRLELDRAMEWSARMRAAGVSEDCPVLGIAATEQRPARERVRAAAVAAGAFEDPRAVAVLEVATAALADDEITSAFGELLEFAPDDLFDVFVVAGASTPRRSLVLAGELLERGATDPAVALTRHAVESTTGRPRELRAAIADALDAPVLAGLLAELQRRGMDGLVATLRAAR